MKVLLMLIVVKRQKLLIIMYILLSGPRFSAQEVDSVQGLSRLRRRALQRLQTPGAEQ